VDDGLPLGREIQAVHRFELVEYPRHVLDVHLLAPRCPGSVADPVHLDLGHRPKG
jgi:hypothetical protein